MNMTQTKKSKNIMVRRESKPIEKHDTRHMFHALMRDKQSACDTIMPNVYVGQWNECDALLVMKSGYTHEVEMKLTRSDFKADFKKSNYWSPELKNVIMRSKKNKHVLLESGTCFPNRFSFLMPEDLVTPDEVPPYAGLMYFRRNEGEYGHIRVERSPKLLHKNKITDVLLIQLIKKFVWRYNDLMQPKLEVMDQYCCPTK